MMGRDITLEREGLARTGEETLAALRARPPQGSDARRYTVRMTSGTSGRAPVVIANEHRSGDARGFEGCGMLVICMGGNNTRLANTLLVRSQSSAAISILPIDEADVAPGLERLMEDLRPDCMRGFTSFVRRVGAAMGEASAGVRLMKLSGEKWTERRSEEFRGMFPHASFDVLYITNEIGVIAARDCPHLALSHYHPAPGVQLEIDAPDESGLGDLLVSKTFFEDTGVSRYRLGDLGRLGTCACGRVSLELVGRKGSDYIKLAGAILFREEFDRVAARCADLFDDYRAEAFLGEGADADKGAIALTVYRADGRRDDALVRAIEERFSSELFLTASRTLKDLVQDGYFLPLRVRLSEKPFPIKNKEVTLTERRS